MLFSYQNIHRVLAVSYFVLCVLIVLYSRELGQLRGFIGDVIVVMFLYSLIQGIRHYNPQKLLIILISIAFSIEGLQYLQFGDIIGWNHIPIIKILFGSTPDMMDLLAYTIGGILSYMTETISIRK